RGRAAVINGTGIAERFAKMPALGVRLEVEATNYIGGEKHRHRIQLSWTAVASIIQDMTPAKMRIVNMASRLTASRLAALTLGALFSVEPAWPASAQEARRPDLAVMKRDYRRPPPRTIENQALVALGRDLFFEPRIS